MKSLIITLGIIILAPSTWALGGGGGGQEGSGGDGSSIEFKQLGLDVFNQIEQSGIFEVKGLKISNLISTLQKAQVNMVSKDLYIRGVKKDAINFYQNGRIDVNIRAWSQLPKKSKYQLVIHETLGLEKIDDANYGKSAYLYRLAQLQGSFDSSPHASQDTSDGFDKKSFITRCEAAFSDFKDGDEAAFFSKLNNYYRSNPSDPNHRDPNLKGDLLASLLNSGRLEEAHSDFEINGEVTPRYIRFCHELGIDP